MARLIVSTSGRRVSCEGGRFATSLCCIKTGSVSLYGGFGAKEKRLGGRCKSLIPRFPRVHVNHLPVSHGCPQSSGRSVLGGGGGRSKWKTAKVKRSFIHGMISVCCLVWKSRCSSLVPRWGSVFALLFSDHTTAYLSHAVSLPRLWTSGCGSMSWYSDPAYKYSSHDTRRQVGHLPNIPRSR